MNAHDDTKTYLTGYPMPHKQRMTFASKWTPRNGTGYRTAWRLEPVGVETDDFQAIVDMCATRDEKSACAVRSNVMLLCDLDNEDGDLVKLVRELIELARLRAADSVGQ